MLVRNGSITSFVAHVVTPTLDNNVNEKQRSEVNFTPSMM